LWFIQSALQIALRLSRTIVHRSSGSFVRLPLVALLVLGVVAGLVSPERVAGAPEVKERMTIVVLDQSGSMRLDLPEKRPRTKASDPLGLRCSAVRLLADLATTRDSLGLIKLESHDDTTDSTADRTAEVLLAPMAMGTAQSRDMFKAKVDCDHATNNTPIADALLKAYEQLAAAKRDRGSSFVGRVILLTDGDPQPQRETQLQEIAQLLPHFAQEGWPISTVGLKLRSNGNRVAIDLLQRIAGVTSGRAYGDIDDPLKLQSVFVDFFAQQTGRSLIPGAITQLKPTGETRVGVADYATRIDVLVAKSNPHAEISLRQPGPNYSEVAENGPGVDLFSNGDSYYAAFSIDKPITGVWSVRATQPTELIVNVLVESHIQLRLENAEVPRASNEPLLIEARFYNRQDDDVYTPATVRGADVGAVATIGEHTYSVPLRDDGSAPDVAANDGLYAGTLTLDSVDDGLAVADVVLTAKAADAEYTDHRSLGLVAVPVVRLAEDTSTLRLAPGSPIDIPLQLTIGQRSAAPAGWDIAARQMIAGELRRVDVRHEGDTFIVRLLPLSDDQEEYDFETDLIGIEQNAGLKRLREPLRVRVVFQPMLKLYDAAIDVVPIGWPITLTAALLKSFNAPAPLRAPLQLNVSYENEPAYAVSRVQDDGSGAFHYTFVPEKPGRYRFTLLPPSDQLVDPVTQDVVVASIPEVRWQPPIASNTPLIVRAVQWRWLDRLRRVPLAGLPADWLFSSYRSEPVRVAGVASRGDEPYTGTLELSLHNAAGAVVATETVADGQIATSWDVPADNYQLGIAFPDAFAPQFGCCRTEASLLVMRPQAEWDGRIAGGIAGAEMLVLLSVVVVARYFLSPKPQPGNKLIFTVAGKEWAVDLKGEQGFALFRPSRVNLTRYFRLRNRTTPGWPKHGIARVTRDGVEFKGYSVPTQNKSIDGYTVRYQPRSPNHSQGLRKPISRTVANVSVRRDHARQPDVVGRLLGRLGVGSRRPRAGTKGNRSTRQRPLSSSHKRR
jgi:Mg-chelatase subunit ChlD